MSNLSYTRLAGGSPNRLGGTIAAAAVGVALLAAAPAFGQKAAQPAASMTDTEGFDRGTGTGEPTESVALLLRLMKRTDYGFNTRDYELVQGETRRRMMSMPLHDFVAGRPAYAPAAERLIPWMQGHPGV